jgi:enoyl-CoA hydratase
MLMAADTPHHAEPSVGRGRIEVKADQRTAWIEMTNPAKLNAISLSMWLELADILDACSVDSEIRCIVIGGQGSRAFCAGADIDEKGEAKRALGEDPEQVSATVLSKLRTCPKPTIAMVSGYCLGAGAAIAIHCDLRVAAEGSLFGIPAARLGLGLPYAVIKRLADLVGPAQAKRVLFTADRLSAHDALRSGLADQVVSAPELLPAVRDLAGRIGANAPLTIRAAKYAVESVFAAETEKDFAGCAARERECLDSEDYREGIRAFAEKRTPRFTGR